MFFLAFLLMVRFAGANLLPESSEIGVMLNMGETKTFSIKFFNTEDVAITNPSITTDPIGADYFTVTYSLPPEIPPHSSVNVTVTIDSSTLEEGQTYTAKVKLSGFENDSYVSAETKINIIVRRSYQQYIQPENVTVIYPSSIDVNQPFEVIVQNYVPRSYYVFVSIEPFKDVKQTNVQVTGNVWKATYIFAKPGIYKVKVYIYNQGALMHYEEKDISVGGVGTTRHLVANYFIQRGYEIVNKKDVKAGDLLVIKEIKCNETGEKIDDAYLTINNIPYVMPATIELKAGETYVLKAFKQGYETFMDTIAVPLSKLRVDYKPKDKFIEGETFKILGVYDSDSGEGIEGYTVYLDGEKLDGNSFVMEHGDHVIRIEAEGYEPYSINITVMSAIHISAPSEKLYVGDKVSWRLPRSISWEVRYKGKNGDLVKSDISNRIEFVGEKEGEYYVLDTERGRVLTVVEFHSRLSGILVTVFVVVVIVAFGILLYVIIKRRKKEPLTEIESKSPVVETAVVEE